MTKEYEIVYTEVKGYPTGIDISWGWKGGGWGHLGFGIKEGEWWSDTECMSEEFITAVLIKAAPQLAKFILENEIEWVNPDEEESSPDP
jgi:hypothetical protein